MKHSNKSDQGVESKPIQHLARKQASQGHAKEAWMMAKRYQNTGRPAKMHPKSLPSPSECTDIPKTSSLLRLPGCFRAASSPGVVDHLPLELPRRDHGGGEEVVDQDAAPARGGRGAGAPRTPKGARRHPRARPRPRNPRTPPRPRRLGAAIGRRATRDVMLHLIILYHSIP